VNCFRSRHCIASLYCSGCHIERKQYQINYWTTILIKSPLTGRAHKWCTHCCCRIHRRHCELLQSAKSEAIAPPMLPIVFLHRIFQLSIFGCCPVTRTCHSHANIGVLFSSIRTLRWRVDAGIEGITPSTYTLTSRSIGN
jgi:hypothetical protein